VLLLLASVEPHCGVQIGGVLATCVVVGVFHCVDTAGLALPPHPWLAHPGLPLCWASVTPNTEMVAAGVLEENRPGSVLVGNTLCSALVEKMLLLGGIPVLGSTELLEKISGTAVGSGPGLAMVVDLKRSSSSLRAE